MTPEPDEDWVGKLFHVKTDTHSFKESCATLCKNDLLTCIDVEKTIDAPGPAYRLVSFLRNGEIIHLMLPNFKSLIRYRLIEEVNDDAVEQKDEKR